MATILDQSTDTIIQKKDGGANRRKYNQNNENDRKMSSVYFSFCSSGHPGHRKKTLGSVRSNSI